ncbi:MAG TPA: arsenite methyltransferase [Anaerolineae bacterium]
MSNDQHMKEKVRERYGAIADRYNDPVAVAPVEVLDSQPEAEVGCCGTTGCCAPASTATTGSLYQVADGVSCSPTGSGADKLAEALYSQTDIADLPDTVTGISLGCGDPTAIANLKPGETVLDLGSGGGIDCFIAAKKVGPTGRVIGVDMTDSMLELANKNKAKIGLENVEFRKGEIENLPVESNTVDVIISNCVINLSPDKDAVFQEAFRVLKPGARFTVSDMLTEGQIPEQLRANVNAWAGCITGALDQNDYLAKLRRAGFVEVEVESRSSYGLENPDSLDETSREALSEGVDWSSVPDDVRLYSARVVAHKPV